MRKLCVLVAVSLFCNLIIAQSTSSITCGYSNSVDKPFKYEFESTPNVYYFVATEYKRTNGFFIGYSYNISLKERLSIDIAPSLIFSNEEFQLLNSDVSGYTNEGDNIYSGKVSVFSEKSSALGARVPVFLRVNIYKSKLFLSTGVNIVFDRLVKWNSIPQYNDAGSDNYYNRNLNGTSDSLSIGKYKSKPYNGKFGVGAQIGVLYEFSRLGISCDFVASRLNDNLFNAVELGLKYKISRN